MSIKLELMHHPYNGVRGGKRGEFLDVGGMGKFPLFRFYRCSVVTYGKRKTLSWKQSAIRLTPSTATHLIHNHSLLAHRMWKYSALLMKLFVKYSTMLKFDVGRNWMRKTCLNTVIIVFNHLLTYSTKFKNVKIISGGICDNMLLISFCFLHSRQNHTRQESWESFSSDIWDIWQSKSDMTKNAFQTNEKVTTVRMFSVVVGFKSWNFVPNVIIVVGIVHLLLAIDMNSSVFCRRGWMG